MKGMRGILIAGALLSAVLLAGVAAAQGGGILLSKNGNILTISGTTTLAAGDRLLINVVSASFTPTEKGGAGGFSGAAGTVTVQPGTPLNTFSFDVDVSAFVPDEYLVTVDSEETGFSESTTFVLPWPTPVPTTLPATVTTATTLPPTTPATTIPATAATPAPAPLPEALALVALSLAFLVLQRSR